MKNIFIFIVLIKFYAVVEQQQQKGSLLLLPNVKQNNNHLNCWFLNWKIEQNFGQLKAKSFKLPPFFILFFVDK